MEMTYFLLPGCGGEEDMVLALFAATVLIHVAP